MSSSDISETDSFTEESSLPENIYLYILLTILYLPSSKNTYLKQKIPEHDMDVSYQLKPLINNLNNTSLAKPRNVETKDQPISKNKSFIAPSSSSSVEPNSPYSFEDILTDNDKERIDMVYDNSVVTNQAVNNNFSLDLNLSKREILDLIKYFFSVYTISQEEASELKRKIRNYSTEGLVKDLEYYLNLLEKDSAFIKSDSFSSVDKYNLWKDTELREVNKLQKFYKFYLESNNNKSKLNKENEDSKNSKLIQLNILEAKSLKAKNSNKFSNPYFIVEVGGKEFESQVIYNNINPSWDFSTVIFLKESDTIKITLWNKNNDKSVKLFKSSKDQFLGQIILTYAEVARYYSYKNILDKWYVLQKRSSKSHISGELRVSFQFIDEQSLSISHSMFTFIPSTPNTCSQYLIETVVRKELECAKDNNTRFIGFSKNAQSLFNSSTILWRVNKLFVISKILNILLDEYIAKNIDAETLYNSVLIDLKENEDIISPKENRKSIKQSLQRLYSYLTRHLSSFNEHFFATENGTDLENTLRLLEFIHRSKFSENYNEDPNYTSKFAESLIQKGIVARYHSIHASINQEDPKIIRIIQLIPKIKDEIADYQENIPRQGTKLNIVSNSIEYFINQINDDISEFKVNPSILKSDLTCSFELIKELVDLRNKCMEVDERFKYKLNIDDYLIICVQEWLRLTNIKANEWINNSIKLDEFKPQDENEYISTSVIDVFTYCNQIFTYFINISWPDKKNLKNCLIHLVMIINKSLTTYLDGMKNTLIDELEKVRMCKFNRDRIKYVNNNRKSFLHKAFTKKAKDNDKTKEPMRIGSELIFEEESSLIVNNLKVCICLNNIAKCKKELEALYERIEKVYESCGGNDDTTSLSSSKELILHSNNINDKFFKNLNKIENKYKSIFENRNDAYIIQPVQYINEKVESPFLNNYFITFSIMGTQYTLQNSAHTKPILKYISTNLNDSNIFYLELPKSNCTLDVCIWHGNESVGYNIYEKTCIVINRDDFIGQPMKEISIKFSDHSQLLVKIKLEDDFLYFYEKQIEKIIEDLLVDLQRILVRNMGGDICYSLGCILEKFENIQDIVKSRVLNSEKMNNYTEPLLTYLQYNLNIFFDKLNNELDPINNIIYFIWLESLAVIKYSAIGELEYKPRSISYEHVSSLNYLHQTKMNINSDKQYSLYAPGRVFKGKLNERQIKYLTYVIQALKDLFLCGGAGVPEEKLEQKEFKEVNNILTHYPYDNRKLKVIYNHHVERSFSLYDDLWILNLLTAKGSSRFIKVKLYEMKVKLEKMLSGLNKKYQSTISFYENHKRITNSSISSESKSSNQPPVVQMPIDMELYEECEDELDSNTGSSYPLDMNSRISFIHSNDNENIPVSTMNSYNKLEQNEYNNMVSSTNVNDYKSQQNIINNTLGSDETLTKSENKPSGGRLLSYYNKGKKLITRNKNKSTMKNNSNSNSNNSMIISSSSINNNNNNNINNNVIMMNQTNSVMMIKPSNNNNNNNNYNYSYNNSNIDISSISSSSSNSSVGNMMMNQPINNNDINLMVMNHIKNSSKNLILNGNRNSLLNMDGNLDLSNIDMSRFGENIYLRKTSSVVKTYEEVEYEFGYTNNINGDNTNYHNGLGDKKDSIIIKLSKNSFYVSNQTLNNEVSNSGLLMDKRMNNVEMGSMNDRDRNYRNGYSDNNININDSNTYNDNSLIKYNNNNNNILDSRNTLINDDSNEEDEDDRGNLGKKNYNNQRISYNQNSLPFVLNNNQDRKVI